MKIPLPHRHWGATNNAKFHISNDRYKSLNSYSIPSFVGCMIHFLSAFWLALMFFCTFQCISIEYSIELSHSSVVYGNRIPLLKCVNWCNCYDPPPNTRPNTLPKKVNRIRRMKSYQNNRIDRTQFGKRK